MLNIRTNYEYRPIESFDSLVVFYICKKLNVNIKCKYIRQIMCAIIE